MIGRLIKAIFDFIFGLLLFILKIAIACVVLFLIFIVTQEFQIFPALFNSVTQKSTRVPGTTPPEIASTFINTPDGKKLEMWTLNVEKKSEPHFAALILNGGEGVIDDYLPYQRWLQSLGIPSYQAEYRGLGKSTGWISEKGMYTDAEAALNYVLGQEEITAKYLIVVGMTLGSAPAAYVTKRFQVGTLVLFSPITSLAELLETHEFKQYLTPFLWYSLPTFQYLKETPACVVMAHGKKDTQIPFSNFEKLQAQYSGRGPLNVVISENATQVNLLAMERDPISNALKQCLNLIAPTGAISGTPVESSSESWSSSASVTSE